MWLLGGLWGAIGVFDLIRSEFLPERLEAYPIVRLLNFLSWRGWLIVFLVLLIGVLLEGGHAAIQKRDETIANLQSQKVEEEQKITIRIHEVHVQSELQGYGKQNVVTEPDGTKNLLSDPIAGWNIFLRIDLVSTFETAVGIREFSLQLQETVNSGIKTAVGPIQDLQHWTLDRKERVPEVWGFHEERNSQPILALPSTPTLYPNLFSQGWLHFRFDSVHMSEIVDGALTLIVTTAIGKRFSGSSNGPRAFSGDVWPVRI